MNRAERRSALRTAPRSTATPRPTVQARIADAVHHTVCDVTGADGVGQCTLYAAIGNALMNAVLADGNYALQAGSMSVRLNRAGDRLSFDTDAAACEGRVGLEFHAWIAAPRGDDAEIVDLTARHWPTWAARAGFAWDLPHPGAYLWMRTSKLNCDRAQYRAEYAPTRLVRDAITETYGESFEQMCRRALRLFNDGGAP